MQGMPTANGQTKRAFNRNLLDNQAGVVVARVVSARAGSAEHLLAMRMRQHAKQADAAATIL